MSGVSRGTRQRPAHFSEYKLEIAVANFFQGIFSVLQHRKSVPKTCLKKGFEKRVSKLSAVLRCYCHLRWFIVNATFSLICFCPLQHRILLPAAPIPSLCFTRKVFFPSKVDGHRWKIPLFKNWQKEMISLRKEEQKTMFLKVTARASRAEEEDCLEPEIFAEQ